MIALKISVLILKQLVPDPHFKHVQQMQIAQPVQNKPLENVPLLNIQLMENYFVNPFKEIVNFLVQPLQHQHVLNGKLHHKQISVSLQPEENCQIQNQIFMDVVQTFMEQKILAILHQHLVNFFNRL